MRLPRRALPWLAVVSPVLVLGALAVAWWLHPSGTVTLSLTRAEALDGPRLQILPDGPDQHRYLVRCDVVLDNQTGEVLTTVYTRKPFERFRLVLWRGDEKVADVPDEVRRASGDPGNKRRPLGIGPTREELWFRVDLPAGVWGELDAQVVGVLPGSAFRGQLESPRVKVTALPLLPAGSVTLSLVKACGIKQQGRHRVFSCEVVLDNQAGKDFSSGYSSLPLDGFRLILWRGDVQVGSQIHGVHWSSFNVHGNRYTLKAGRTDHELRFPLESPPGASDDDVEAQVVGYLSESPFAGRLESGRMKVRWVEKWDWQ